MSFRPFIRRQKLSPATPDPSNKIVDGSGMGCGVLAGMTCPVLILPNVLARAATQLNSLEILPVPLS